MRTWTFVVERFWNLEKKNRNQKNKLKQPQSPLAKIPRAQTPFALSYSFRCVPSVCQEGGLSTRKLHNSDVNDSCCPLNSCEDNVNLWLWLCERLIKGHSVLRSFCITIKCSSKRCFHCATVLSERNCLVKFYGLCCSQGHSKLQWPSPDLAMLGIFPRISLVWKITLNCCWWLGLIFWHFSISFLFPALENEIFWLITTRWIRRQSFSAFSN